VLFLFDPEADHRGEIEGWGHEDIRCLVADAPGLQAIYPIEHQFAGEKVLVYHPSARPRDLSTYPLADLLVANAELTVRPEEEIADRHGLQPQEAERLAACCGSDVQHADVRDFLAPILDFGACTRAAVERGLTAYHLGLFSALPASHDHVLAGVLIAATDAEGFEAFTHACQERGLAEPLARRVARRLKYNLLTHWARI
jgi:hypothetical protein